jgi:hypothetical protein
MAILFSSDPQEITMANARLAGFGNVPSVADRDRRAVFGASILFVEVIVLILSGWSI